MQLLISKQGYNRKSKTQRQVNHIAKSKNQRKIENQTHKDARKSTKVNMVKHACLTS